MEHEFLYELLSSQGVSGREAGIQKKAAAYMRDFADEVRVEKNGNVTGVINPDGRCRILLAAHIDEIGLMVTAYTKEGFLRVAKVGGIMPRMYLGQKVRISAENKILYGAVVNSKELQNKGDFSEMDLLVDIGAENQEESRGRVPVGATVTFDTDWRLLDNKRITARALDNRSGVYIVTMALKRAKEKGCKNQVCCVTTVGEETTCSGGAWAGTRIKPDMAIAVDVTFASDVPGGDDGVRGSVRLGGGPGICVGTMAHPVLNTILKHAADKTGILLQPVIAPGRTCTDLDAIHISGQGVPAALVNLPLRSMHSPAEVCSLKDVEGCIEIISEFVCMVDENTDLRPF